MDDETLQQPGAEKCWSVLERTAESAHLKRSPRLKEFLFYVGKKSVIEGCHDIHEQEIGTMVFGRADSYDTSQDNIVRVSATALRKRIRAYFSSEGENEPITFEIPPGSYTPVFQFRTSNGHQADSSPEPDTSEPSQAMASDVTSLDKPSLFKRTVTSVSIGMAIVLAVYCGILWRDNRSLCSVAHAWEGQPALASFWPRFLNPSHETDIILADTSFVLIEDLTKRSYSLNDYVNRTYVRDLQAYSTSDDRKVIDSLISRSYGSVGDFRVAQRIQSLDYGATNVVLNYARDYAPSSTKTNNVIVIGSEHSNPWAGLLKDQINFQITYDSNRDQPFVKNLHPRPSEQPSYYLPADPHPSVGYGVIAYLPTPNRKGDALLIEGTDSAATNAAGDFVTSETGMSSLLKQFPAGRVPYFEILLKTERLGSAGIDAKIETVRSY